MKFSEIERLFTQKVAEYMVQGYTVDVRGTRSFGGEIGKVDLRNGNSIVRVRVAKRYVYSFDDNSALAIYFPERIILQVLSMSVVGRDKDTYNSWACYSDSEFDVLEGEEWVCLSDSWFVTIDEAKGLLEKKKERSFRKYEAIRYKHIPLFGYENLLLKIARKYKGMRSVKLGDIYGYVVCVPYDNYEGHHEVGHYIRAKNKEIKIL